MAKYDDLRVYFSGLAELTWTARLEEIEEIIGSKLPGSAFRHRTWWANSGGNLVHQNAWLQAGWKVDRADLSRGVVHFCRSRVGGMAVARGAAVSGRQGGMESNGHKAPKASQCHGRFAKLQQSLGQPVTITLRAEWTSVGDLQQLSDEADWVNDDGGLLRMVVFKDADPQTILIACNRLRQAVGALRSLGQGDDTPPELAALKPLAREAFTEVHVLRPGNAWLLADGKGRKADLVGGEERAMVAQLLLLQERQSGRGRQLLQL